MNLSQPKGQTRSAIPVPNFTPPGSKRAAEADYFRALVEELVHFRRSQSEAIELLGGLVRNHVLECELVIIGADGFAQRQWHTPCGAVAITPAKMTGPFTVVSGPATSNVAPTSGIGMGQYGFTGTPVNTVYPTRVFNLSAREVTVYGNVGDAFTLQVFTRPMPPA
jgi:hypothetical protein